jgi:hypothetical protein
MNKNQTIQIIGKFYNGDAKYWAPEVIADNLLDFIDQNDPYLIPLVVLIENTVSFKNRMEGIVKDDWFSRNTFHPIAEKCVFILSKLDKLESWQITLINEFKKIC